MKKTILNGIEYKVITGIGTFEEKLKKNGFQYIVRNIKNFELHSMEFTSYRLKIYTYRSMKTNNQVYVASIEWSDLEDIYFLTFQSYTEISDETAIYLEELYSNNKLEIFNE